VNLCAEREGRREKAKESTRKRMKAQEGIENQTELSFMGLLSHFDFSGVISLIPIYYLVFFQLIYKCIRLLMASIKICSVKLLGKQVKFEYHLSNFKYFI